MGRATARWCATAALAVALLGCSRSEPDQAEPSDVAPEPTTLPTPSPTVVILPSPTPSPSATPVAEAPPPASDPGEEEQMLDDASATGMTARSERDRDVPADPLPSEPTPANAEMP